MVCLLSHNKIIRDSTGLLVYASILKVLQREACRRPTKREKWRKMLVVGRRNTEIAGKCSSSVDEMRKSRKNTRRRLTKREKQRKMLIVDRRNAKNDEKRSSSVDEMLDLPKIIRHPWMKTKKRQKMPVIRG
ncbi:hypothetical protein [Segatella oris]|uniref:hypothetical protein n=1 Tax=Segatella oris TaxID=28135 RepID=UPI000F838867|nr:hypothetical protein [Segatella oris]